MLKCVGYDKAFQQKVFNDMKTWVPPPKQEPKDPKKNTLQPNKGPKSRKRKRVEEEILESDNNDMLEDEDEDEDAHLEFISRGTRSRPRS